MNAAPRSLQRRLLALTMGWVVAVWAAAAAVTWTDTRQQLDELLDSHLAQAAALLVAQQTHDFADDGDGPGLRGEGSSIDAPILHRYAPKVAFQVFHEGRLALRSANAPAARMSARGADFRSGFETLTRDGMTWRVFAAYGSERDVQVYVGEQTTSRADILWAVLRGMLWPMALALPLLALATGWAVHRGLLPLRRLGAALAARQPQSIAPVSADGAPAEMAPMVAALNGLLERIGRLRESERRFTADAAHELRTPIAAIRAQAQAALGESDAAERHHALRATMEGCDRAARLVEQLLMLSRLDIDAAPAMQHVALAALARRVAADLAPRALAKSQTLALEASGEAGVWGNEALLGALLRNLLDNAVRYSPPGASVQLSLQATAGSIDCTVEDSGPGLTGAELARLGERFFRAGGNDETGSGLGWSIAQRVAQAHGATLTAGRSAALGGLAVSLRLPAAPAI